MSSRWEGRPLLDKYAFRLKSPLNTWSMWTDPIRQALAALKLNGLISMVGSISAFTSPGSNDTKEPTFLETVIHTCTVQGISIGSRMQFEAMNHAIEVNDLHPVLDARIFKLEEAREAYQYVWDQKHFGKVVIQVAS